MGTPEAPSTEVTEGSETVKKILTKTRSKSAGVEDSDSDASEVTPQRPSKKKPVKAEVLPLATEATEKALASDRTAVIDIEGGPGGEDADSLVRQAQQLRITGNPAAAESRLRDAVQKDPSHRVAQLRLGLIIMARKDYEAAEDIFRQVRTLGGAGKFVCYHNWTWVCWLYGTHARARLASIQLR